MVPAWLNNGSMVAYPSGQQRCNPPLALLCSGGHCPLGWVTVFFFEALGLNLDFCPAMASPASKCLDDILKLEGGGFHTSQLIFYDFFLFTSLGLFHHQSRAHPNRFGSNAGEILAWSPSRFVAQYWWWNQRNFHAFEPNLFWWIFFRLVRLSQEVGLGPRLSTKDSGHQRPSFGQGWRVGQKSPATWARLSASGIFTWVAKGKCLGWRNIFECVMALLIVSVSWFFLL